LELSKNILGIQLFVGTFEELKRQVNDSIYYKEHPFSYHFTGVLEHRDWLNPDIPSEKSFFRYWKELKKSLPEIA
jgi:hypothetical protein